ncbi:AraC family transcriptional regulator [Reinekea sp. G2M2-21]|uniref:AraC family transcriptional regulator n=1 Tax=Reinekea sp. G2M2-21 TaxID=2788942 RepID=UPI0018A8BA1E|nr:AraC family transcriptional regulator [Reinekea sp. G2M2-21]
MPDTHQDSTVSYHYLRGIVEYLNRRECAVEPFFAQAGIALELLNDGDRRLPSTTFLTLLEAAGKLASDPAVGLHVGECIKPGQYGVLGYAVMSSQTVQEAFARHERYEALVSNRAQSRYQLGNEECSLTWNTGADEAACAIAEENVAAWVTFSRWITGQNLRPLSVHFRHSAPEYLAEYERIFQCPVLFEQPVVEVRFPTTYLHLPITQHDPLMQEMMDAHAERLLQQFNQTDSLIRDVRRLIIEGLAQATLTLESLSESLGMTPRTLQRRLRERDETFNSLLERTRKDLAMTYINQADVSLPELAYLLGYADQTAFQRAFKKWTGTTPGKYRKGEQL